MAARATGAAPPMVRGGYGGGRGAYGAVLERWAVERSPALDNLKVIVVAAVIVVHAVLGYAGMIEVWSYTGVSEVTLSPVTEAVLLVAFAPFGFLTMALLFLIAGLLTPASLERKGPGRFARDRLLRLGVPFVAYVLIVQPTVMYALEHPLGAATGSFWYEMVGDERRLDTGPLWFVGTLLIFSLGYAGWAGVLRRRTAGRRPDRITTRRLLLIVAWVVPASFLIRLVYPYGGDSGFTDLNFWQWPACAAMFTLGIAAWRLGWRRTVPDELYRRSRTVTLWAATAMAVFLVGAGLLDLIDSAMGGWHWAAVGFTSIEVTLLVFGSVLVLGTAQRRLDRPLWWAGPGIRRSAYGAFILQTPVLIGLAVGLRSLPVPAETKALVVAIGGVAGSFGLARLLSQVPFMRRVL